MNRPRLLDLFCGAGGCSVGYHRAGFEVIGVDHKPQKHYPFEFHQADALEFLAEHGREYDAIHASPPCQYYTDLRARHRENKYPNLIGATREMLVKTGRLYVIENVEGAPLYSPIMLCGSAFGLRVRRHRLFESNRFLLSPGCCHAWQDNDKCFKIYEHGKWFESGVVRVYGHGGGKGATEQWRKAMDIDWMNRNELSQAIPPVYTTFIGRQLLRYLKAIP